MRAKYNNNYSIIIIIIIIIRNVLSRSLFVFSKTIAQIKCFILFYTCHLPYVIRYQRLAFLFRCTYSGGECTACLSSTLNSG